MAKKDKVHGGYAYLNFFFFFLSHHVYICEWQLLKENVKEIIKSESRYNV